MHKYVIIIRYEDKKTSHSSDAAMQRYLDQ